MSGFDERWKTALDAVKRGDFSVRLPEDDPETAEAAAAFNALLRQTRALCSEVNRLMTEMMIGKLGGQAEIPGLFGEWLRLQNNVNTLAYSMTIRLRRMALTTGLMLDDSQTAKAPADEIHALENNIDTLARQHGVLP
jgi:HAMP domain-containing protein